MSYNIETSHSTSPTIGRGNALSNISRLKQFTGRSISWVKQGLAHIDDIAFQAKTQLSSQIQDKKNRIQENIKLFSLDENQLMGRLALAVEKSAIDEVDLLLTKYTTGKIKTSLNPLLISKIQQAVLDETNENLYAFDKHHLAKMHLAIIERLCQAGADINCRDPEGNTMLMLASRGCSEKIIKAVLISSENINEKNDRGETALMQTQDPAIAKLLITVGVNVRAKDIDGNTALHLACLRGTKNMIEVFLENGLSINEKGAGDQTPLIIACKRRDKGIISLLHRFHINYFREHGDPLNIAQRDIHNESAASLMVNDFLLENCLLEFMHELDEEGFTPLMNIFSNDPKTYRKCQKFDQGLTEWWIEQKMMAHRFGFNSKVSFLNHLHAPLNGFRADFTYDILIKSFQEFKKTLVGNLKDWESQDSDHVLTLLEEALENFQYGDMPDVEKKGAHAFISGWKEHCAAIVVSDDILIKCDRGGEDNKTGLKIFKIGDRTKLKETLSKSCDLKYKEEGKEFFLTTINSELQLQEKDHLFHKIQFGGNCGWATAKLTLEALIYLQFLNKGLTHQEAVDRSKSFYNAWFDYDREQAVERYLQRIQEIFQFPFSLEIKQQMCDVVNEILNNVLGKCIAGKASKSRSDIFVKILNQYPAIANNIPLTQAGNPYKYNFLTLAVSRGKLKEVKLLLDSKASVHQDNRMFLLTCACNHEGEKVKSLLSLLMNYGFDLNELDADGKSMFWHVAHANQKEILQVLIELGCDIHINKDLLQSLRSKDGMEEIIQFLLEKGVQEE